MTLTASLLSRISVAFGATMYTCILYPATVIIGIERKADAEFTTERVSKDAERVLGLGINRSTSLSSRWARRSLREFVLSWGCGTGVERTLLGSMRILGHSGPVWYPGT